MLIASPLIPPVSRVIFDPELLNTVPSRGTLPGFIDVLELPMLSKESAIFPISSASIVSFAPAPVRIVPINSPELLITAKKFANVLVFPCQC